MLTIVRPACRLLLVAALAGSAPAWAQESGHAPVPPDDTQAAAPVDIGHEDGALTFKSRDGRFEWTLGGRLMVDTAFYFNSDNDLANGAELRRARAAVGLVLWRDWTSQLEIDVADGTLAVTDAWIAYTGLRNSLVRAGHFRAPFGLETLTSSKDISLMERSLIDHLSPDRRIGIAFSHWRDRWQTAAGIFGPPLDRTADTSGQDQSYSLVGRVTALPYTSGDNIVHLGVAGGLLQPERASGDDPSGANRWRVRARPETHVNRGYFLSTPDVPDVDHARLIGVEAAAVLGSWSFQAEYNGETLSRTEGTLPRPHYDGWYALASWFPTGEHRPYDPATGEFARLVPRGPRGALEVVARYSTMDVNDADAGVLGGRQRIATVGANWYANANVRLMVNHLFVVSDDHARGDRNYTPGDRFNVLQARLQVAF